MTREIRHSAVSNYDFDFFFDGLENGKLLVQRCSGCGRLRNPPGPMCPACRSLEFDGFALAGTGTVYSYTVHHHPPLPAFPTPHIIIVAEMDEGVRVVSGLAGVEPQDVEIGQRVEVEFYRHEKVASFRFRPASRS